VVDGSLTGADINERTLQGVSHRLFFTANAGAPRQTLVTLGGYRIAAECQDGGDIENGIVLAVNGPSGTFDYWQTSVSLQNAPGSETGQELKTGGLSFGANIWTQIGGEYSPGQWIAFGDHQHYGRAAGTVIVTAGPTTIQIDFQAAAYGPSGGNDCWVQGSATKLV
jgi:hypothetical protein